jgi:hypothetical protein
LTPPGAERAQLAGWKDGVILAGRAVLLGVPGISGTHGGCSQSLDQEGCGGGAAPNCVAESKYSERLWHRKYGISEGILWQFGRQLSSHTMSLGTINFYNCSFYLYFLEMVVCPFPSMVCFSVSSHVFRINALSNLSAR